MHRRKWSTLPGKVNVGFRNRTDVSAGLWRMSRTMPMKRTWWREERRVYMHFRQRKQHMPRHMFASKLSNIWSTGSTMEAVRWRRNTVQQEQENKRPCRSWSGIWIYPVGQWYLNCSLWTSGILLELNTTGFLQCNVGFVFK